MTSIWWLMAFLGCRPATVLTWEVMKFDDGESFLLKEHVGGVVFVIKKWKSSGATRTWPIAVCKYRWQTKPLMRVCKYIALGIDPMDIEMIGNDQMEIHYGWCISLDGPAMSSKSSKEPLEEPSKEPSSNSP